MLVLLVEGVHPDENSERSQCLGPGWNVSTRKGSLELMYIVEHTTQSDPHIIRVETLILT